MVYSMSRKKVFSNEEIYSTTRNDQIVFGWQLISNDDLGMKLIELDDSFMKLIINPEILSYLNGFALIVNGYDVLSMGREEMNMDDKFPYNRLLPPEINQSIISDVFPVYHQIGDREKNGYISFSPFRINLLDSIPNKLLQTEIEELNISLARG